MKLEELVQASRSVAETAGRLEKIERLASLLARLEPREVEVAVAYLCGDVPQGRIGLGPAAVREAFSGTAAATAQLTVTEVDRAFSRIAAVSGKGSAAERARLLRDLFAAATRPEQEFLARLIFGELRQGALEGVMVEAVARASGVDASRIRRAVMLAGELPSVAAAALARGESGLADFALRIFRPVQPMLAQTASGVGEALQQLERASFEDKLDGARVQVHKSGPDVRVFSRSLNEVTDAVPEIVESMRALSAGQLILDGEAIALRADGRPHPFQTTMRRFGRKLDVAGVRGELPLSPFFFDCLHVDGRDLIDLPASDRFDAMARALPEPLLIRRLVTAEPAEAAAFLESALERGHEGVMAKSLSAPYEAGARGSSWFKVKPVRTLDLVVLAAEWGHGRRRGWLSNLHLGARDPATGGFVMLGKTFKGMTDEILDWQTRTLLPIEIARDSNTVYVEPRLVAEVAFNDVQASPHYPGGLALRFARLKRYRPDKRPQDADTIDTVRAIHGQGAA